VEDSVNDHELRDLFQGLRAEDREAAPGFDEMMARVKEAQDLPEESRSPRVSWVRRPRRWVLTGGLLAAAVAAAVLLMDTSTTTDARFEEVVRAFASDPALGAWESPTDGLLDVPGIELLRTVPTIGNPRWPGQPQGDPHMNQL
jgi:hypothetical protein